MAFTDLEIAEHTITLENHLWKYRRPPLEIRELIREGQRFTDQSIELFFVRPSFSRPGEQIEDSIAKLVYVRSRNVWRIYWKRSNEKWYPFPPRPETKTLTHALRIVHQDGNACFFG